MDLSRLAFWVPIIGVLLFSISIGGAVLGSYASIQEDFNHCGDPLIHVTPPDQTHQLSGSSAEGPSYPVLTFEELSVDEQEGFRRALARTDNVGKVNGTLDHHSEIENGAIVLYQGERHYVTVESENGCIGTNPLVLPLGVLGTVVGIGLVVTPSLWKQLGGPGSQSLGREIADPRIVVFDGEYADFWTFVVFTIGVLLGLLHWVGLLIGAVLLGFVASTTRRAVVFGLYLGCIVALLFAAYSIVISALIGVSSWYPGALFSTVYPSFVTAIPLAVLVCVVIRILLRTSTGKTTR